MSDLAPMRTAYGEALVALGEADERVVALTADVRTSDFSHLFAEAFPERYFDVGIAEQCLVDVAAGLAYEGMIPFANAFAVFLASRALEPILTHLCYGRANVKLMAGYSGISPQMEGPTHHAISDIAVMRSLPGMAVVSPADTTAMRALLPQVAAWPGPVYYRFCRNEVPTVHGEGTEFRIGTATPVRPGGDVTFVAVGTLVARCLQAADRLALEGVEAGVIDMHTIKPLDAAAVVRAATQTGAIVTAEEHTVLGGLGAAVAETVSCAPVDASVVRVGLADRFIDSGTYEELLDTFGMSVDDLVTAARRAMSLRDRGRPE